MTAVGHSIDLPGTCHLSADVGGTFTDVVGVAADGSIAVEKVLSTTGQLEVGVVEGVRSCLGRLGLDPRDVAMVRHATTAATNAVLERKGAFTALITTRGFRDVLELRRLRVPALYDVFWRRPDPLVPRNLCLEVTERVAADGTIITPLDAIEAKTTIRSLAEQGIESIAVCLIHAYRNPAHELELANLIRKELPDVYVSLSHQVLPEAKEYERTSTTVTNAYVAPILTGYLGRLGKALDGAGVRAPLLVQQSSGGLMTARAAGERPVFSLESGPAAGVVGAGELARKLGITRAVAFDMGGTTAKAAVIEDGLPQTAPEYEIGAPVSVSSRLLRGGGYLLRVRAVDISEIGAGGGSILSVDAGGSLQVGPRSAGAAPGPICYGRGGVEPTVTDANVLLGFLSGTHLLGGMLPVYAEQVPHRFEAAIAKRLGISIDEAAFAVHVVANATMARAINSATTERGRDAREYVLIAYGGSGPVHAALLARSLGIRKVVIPPMPGLFSAMGLLSAPLEEHEISTILQLTTALTDANLESAFDALEATVTQRLHEDGVSTDAVLISRLAEVRYADQVHELTITVPPRPPSLVAAISEGFEDVHESTYGHRGSGDPIELVNIRVVAKAPIKVDRIDRHRAQTASTSPTSTRRAYFGPQFGHIDTPLVRRGDISKDGVEGPAILDEYDTTIVIPPGFHGEVDDDFNVILTW